MTRGGRPKPSTDLISPEILREIKCCRPLRLFINKQKKKGSGDNAFSLRVRFCQLAQGKKARFLQRSVDRYLELLDEKDVDESVQIECRLFDYLLMKSEQKKYFQSINAPIKPPGTVPYYTQFIKQETDEENETEWDSLSSTEQENYKKMRKEAKAEYPAQVRNFANDLPERLRTDYLIFAQQVPTERQTAKVSSTNGHENSNNPQPVRQRRKSLTPLPESLQTTGPDDDQPKLTKKQLLIIHQCMPSALYYENEVLAREKPTFTRAMTRNAYIRSLFSQLNETERSKYIFKAIDQWKEFLDANPNILEHQIPTLHLLLSRNEDVVLYFSLIGLPTRPPINSYLLYNHEKNETNGQQSWADLSSSERLEYAQQLYELKTEYYEKLMEFVDRTLPNDYMRYELLRNVKYAVRDYELATKSQITDTTTGQIRLREYYREKMTLDNDMNQFHQIKERLLSTRLTSEQKNLVEELSQLLCKYMG